MASSCSSGTVRLCQLVCTSVIVALALASCAPTTPTGGEKSRSERRAKTHLVEVVVATRESVNSAHERSGSLQARRKVEIHNQEEGRVQELPYYEGDPVERGAILARLDDDLLRAELDKARATTRLARINLKRLADLVKKRAASDDERARAQTALEVAEAEQKLLQTRLDHTRIRSPIDGLVTARLAEPGDVVAKYSHLLTISDPGSLTTRINVSELLLPHLQPGDPVSVRIDALGRTRFNGHIQRIFPELNPATRQGVVEVSLDSAPSGVRAGQFARVRLTTAVIERILIPFSALRREREGEFVYRLSADNLAERVRVRSGIRIGDRIELLEGVAPGDRIVSRGFLGLSAGNKVTPVTDGSGGAIE